MKADGRQRGSEQNSDVGKAAIYASLLYAPLLCASVPLCEISELAVVVGICGNFREPCLVCLSSRR